MLQFPWGGDKAMKEHPQISYHINKTEQRDDKHAAVTDYKVVSLDGGDYYHDGGQDEGPYESYPERCSRFD
jgi:hypothetical protein